METTSSDTSHADDVAQIRSTIEPWNRCCLERDWGSLLAMCTEDILFSGPGGEKVVGDAVRAWLDAFPVQTHLEWDFDRLEVSGNLATGSGSGRMTLEVEGQATTLSFDFCDVFRKGEDGQWRYSSVIFNENPPSQ